MGLALIHCQVIHSLILYYQIILLSEQGTTDLSSDPGLTPICSQIIDCLIEIHCQIVFKMMCWVCGIHLTVWGA